MNLTRDDLVAMVNKSRGQSFAVGKNLHLVSLELWWHGLFESYSNTCQIKHYVTINKQAELNDNWKNIAQKCFILPAIAWLWGPPCSPGNTAWLIKDSKLYIISFPLLSTLRTPAGEERDKNQTVVEKDMYISWFVYEEDWLLHLYLFGRKWVLRGSRGVSCALLWTRCHCAQRAMAQFQQPPARWCVPCLPSDMRCSH